jgi:hypothetical protein
LRKTLGHLAGRGRETHYAVTAALVCVMHWILPQLIATDSAVRAYTSNVPNAFQLYFIDQRTNSKKSTSPRRPATPTRNSDSNIKEPVPLMQGLRISSETFDGGHRPEKPPVKLLMIYSYQLHLFAGQ